MLSHVHMYTARKRGPTTPHLQHGQQRVARLAQLLRK